MEDIFSGVPIVRKALSPKGWGEMLCIKDAINMGSAERRGLNSDSWELTLLTSVRSSCRVVSCRVVILMKDRWLGPL
jgi:hypothetical protein